MIYAFRVTPDGDIYAQNITEDGTLGLLHIYNPDLKPGPELMVFPNPCNESTNITMYVPDEQAVSITLYNQNGKVLKEVIQELLCKGSKSLKFKRDGLPSGIYYMVLN